jgi:hypothetical protein
MPPKKSRALLTPKQPVEQLLCVARRIRSSSAKEMAALSGQQFC